MQVAFVLPTEYPVSTVNFNWTPVTVALVLAGVLAVWYAPCCGARRWYHGKAHTLEDASEQPMVRGVPVFSLKALSFLYCSDPNFACMQNFSSPGHRV